MARPLYPHEIGDPDFFWLISNFREKHPDFYLVEIPGLPVTLITQGSKETNVGESDDTLFAEKESFTEAK